MQASTQVRPIEASRTWKAYHGEEKLWGWWMSSWLRTRRSVSWPLQRSVYVAGAGHFSVGEVILLAGLLGGSAYSCYSNWYDPDAMYTFPPTTSDGRPGHGYSPVSVKSSGTLPNIFMALVLGTACHNSVLSLLLGIPFERAIRWHTTFAVLALLTGLYHGWMAIRRFRWDFEYDTFLTGFVFAASMGVLVLTSLVPVRRVFYNSWRVMHDLIAVASIASGILHCGGIFLAGLGFLALDLVIRYLIRAARNPNQAILTKATDDVVFIKIARSKDWHYLPGQYCFVCFPKLGVFQWHPLSFSSSPDCDPEWITFHMRALGDWGKRVLDLSTPDGAQVDVLVDGPYGEPSVDISGPRLSRFLIVGGGIGVTPMLSICNNLLFEHDVMGRPVRSIRFIWTLRDKALLGAITCPRPRNARDPVPESSSALEQSDPLRAQVFLTGSNDSKERPPGSPNEALGHLELCHGRPDIRKILEEEKTQALAAQGEKDSSTVAVLVCGPEALTTQVTRTALALSSRRLRFLVHSEKFHL